ncbi:MAG: type II toxin-antitoxin system HicA family toxin [Thermoguttaceae bacterium]
MKRRELESAGCVLYRHAGRHDIYLNRQSGRKAPVPRHDEVRDSLCRLIRRQLGLGE